MIYIGTGALGESSHDVGQGGEYHKPRPRVYVKEVRILSRSVKRALKYPASQIAAECRLDGQKHLDFVNVGVGSAAMYLPLQIPAKTWPGLACRRHRKDIRKWQETARRALPWCYGRLAVALLWLVASWLPFLPLSRSNERLPSRVCE
jgi:hypothetical protein